VPSLRDSFPIIDLTSDLRPGLLYAAPAGLRPGGAGASFSDASATAALFLRAITGGRKSQNPERRRSGGYRDASTAQGGRFVLPASLCMTTGVIGFGRLRPDGPGPPDSRGRLSPHELECSEGGGVAAAKYIGPSSGEERPPQDDSSCLDPGTFPMKVKIRTG
jgi:hypothetical protein